MTPPSRVNVCVCTLAKRNTSDCLSRSASNCLKVATLLTVTLGGADTIYIYLIVQPILDLLYIHLFIELSWKSNISYLATYPIKK